MAVEGNVIKAVGDAELASAIDARRASPPFPGESFAILPALVNAHTHLELSWTAGRLPPSDRFDDWIRGIVGLRRQYPGGAPASAMAAARGALEAARASGTGVFGDISNTLITVGLFRQAGLSARVFYELIGFNTPAVDDLVRAGRERIDGLADGGDTVRISLAPHAPYSVSPGLFAAVRRDLDGHDDGISTVHLGESRDEIEFLMSGGGRIRRALEELGAWNSEWTPPGCGPVRYLERIGFLRERMLIVHGVQFTDDELGRLADIGATLVTCPRSNQWTAAGSPPVDRFYSSGVRVAIGTDSLASVEDLNMFADMAAVRALAPGVPASRILDSATRAGAEALGFGDRLGTIEAGKRADLIAVRVPPAVLDVEEYLLSGIAASEVRWLSES